MSPVFRNGVNYPGFAAEIVFHGKCRNNAGPETRSGAAFQKPDSASLRAVEARIQLYLPWNTTGN
jgi:hypothetical protein